MKTVTIRHVIYINASPQKVYEALMDSRRHAEFTHAPASVSPEVGGAFNVYDGSISGTNLELEPDHRIVQLWRAGDWPAGHYSKVTFTLTEVPDGTRITFTQSGVPGKNIDEIRQGWRDYYWIPLREYLEE
jgi:activator of HSP90 ATPase